ncbi:glycine cleavage system protein GcvH [Magnetovibrio sp. PR-2]|uniref:glycine cleavage system protein GcvH n=1 Tax=Magnetovibrio sp. PR-2 TaxID=3120356 RepID=UPI002FCE0DC3
MSVLFTDDHEWISVDGDVATVGITDYALQQLGDLVFIEVPEAGRTVMQGEEAAVVESVKAASEVYAPVAGDVVDGNGAIADDPAAVSGDTGGDGWFFKIKMSEPSQLDGLKNEAEYKAYVDGLD